MQPMQRYWDACCFLGWFNKENDKVEYCRGVLQLAEKGKVNIITSAITFVEVIKIKGEQPIKKEKEEKIKAFFENEYIKVRDVDRFIAEYARELIWQFPHLHPYDSIHLATALWHNVTVMNTFDKPDLIDLSEKVGKPLLKICKPDIQYQIDAFD